MEENRVLALPYRPSPTLLKKRCYATTVDLFLVSIMAKAIFHTYLNFVKSIFSHLPYNVQIASISKLFPLFLVIFTASFFGYFVLSYYLGGGQTPGKMMFNLKVVTTSTRNHLTFYEGVTRTLGYFLCYNMGFFLFSIPFFRKDARGIPDYFSKTLVTVAHHPHVITLKKTDSEQISKAA